MKQAIFNYLEKEQISQNQLAKQLGISGSQLNLYLNDKYKGDVVSLEERLKAFLNGKQEQNKSEKVAFEFVETLTAGRMRNTIEYAHYSEEISVIVGDAGLGKTYILQEYAKQHKEVVLINSTGIMNVKNLLTSMCRQLGLEEKGFNPVLFERIVNKLKRTGRLILIDEAENLNIKNLEILRRIHDFTECGIVMAGKHDLLRNLTGKKKELRQLYSRVAFLCDIGYSLPAEDIAAIASSYLNTSLLNDVIIKHAKGSARRVRKIIKGALRLGEVNKTEVNKKTIENISSMLIN